MKQYTRDEAIKELLNNAGETEMTVEEVCDGSAPYVVFAGQDRNTEQPVEAVFAKSDIREVAKDFAQHYPYVEVVYMPEDDIDTNKVVAIYQRGKKIK